MDHALARVDSACPIALLPVHMSRGGRVMKEQTAVAPAFSLPGEGSLEEDAENRGENKLETST